MKNLLLIYQLYQVFREPFSLPVIKSLDNTKIKELISLLMSENFFSLKNSKKYKTGISVDYNDFPELPGLYSTKDTLIGIRNIPDNQVIENNLDVYDYKRIVIIPANSFMHSQERIEYYFKILETDDNRIVAGFSEDKQLTFLGFNYNQFDYQNVFNLKSLTEDKVLKVLTNCNAELIVMNEGMLCTKLENVKNLISIFKNNPSKAFSSQMVLFLTSLISNNKGLL